ncbi:hypothetical protein [Hymenobacter sp. PAMC 26628]|uniref:hypothetical protein n=1 Tax=Hymenobacter sp. PAMC 26628 TaxID=1484118 RepID=UPI000770007D|nr:hypothetical protein [Hymenobacter sp. PAMC 26628]AMJ64897.1 hypothetical protein AXW84_05260 [Hymenobacter sp. PAMC 26628]
MKNLLLFPALAALLGACSGNATTPPAAATAPASTMATTDIGERFMEAAMKYDSVKVRSMLADHIVVLGATPKQRMTGIDSAATIAFTSNDGTADMKFMPLAKGGDANMVYYSGFYSQKVLPSAKHKFKGGTDTGSYLMIASKDSKNDWKISYCHFAQAPLQENK